MPRTVEQPRQQYPEFYWAGMGINRFLVNKAMADDALANLRRQVFWYSSASAARGGKPAVEAASLQASLEQESGALDTAMNDLYQTYGKAFDDG